MAGFPTSFIINFNILKREAANIENALLLFESGPTHVAHLNEYLSGREEG